MHPERIKARKRRSLVHGDAILDLSETRQQEAIDAHAAHSAWRGNEVEGNFAKVHPYLRADLDVFPEPSF
jgi:hypothetical protein